MPNRIIYMDHHATTPCDPRVVEAMLPYFSEDFANPGSSLHGPGRKAADAVNDARQSIADVLGVRPSEIVFTSGATESNNLAIFGTARHASATRRRIVTIAIEHKSVLAPCRHLADQGYDVVVLPVESDGRLSLSQLEKALGEGTLLVTVQAANNEIGTLQDITAISGLAHSCGAIVHCDAAQAVGKVPFDFLSCEADLISVSAHKLYGPKGIGMLFVREGVHKLPISPTHFGGGQEFGLRPGTPNVPAIVGFAKALELCRVDQGVAVAELRDNFERAVHSSYPGARRNGCLSYRLPGNSSMTFPGIDAEALIANVPELALSTGAACTNGAPDPSYVLTAIGLSRADALSTIRFGFGYGSTADDTARASQLILEAISILSTKQMQIRSSRSIMKTD